MVRESGEEGDTKMTKDRPQLQETESEEKRRKGETTEAQKKAQKKVREDIERQIPRPKRDSESSS
jgi:hypothetical protein